MDTIKIDSKSKLYRLRKKISVINIFVTLLGGLLGYLFYYYTQCCVDNMTIPVNPYISIFYGLVFGALISYRRKK